MAKIEGAMTDSEFHSTAYTPLPSRWATFNELLTFAAFNTRSPLPLQ